ncbi:MAG TPA: heat shock protein HspQ [Gammaproteobacteria bacterium]
MAFSNDQDSTMLRQQAKFNIGQIIRHAEHGYRGVVADVDPRFLGPEEMYAKAEPAIRLSKEQPWYHILVDGDSVQTYVAEQSLRSDGSAEPVDHPYVDDFFSSFERDHYITRQSIN